MVQGTVQAKVHDREWRVRFEACDPRIARLAWRRFRRCTPQLREELSAETIADVDCAYARLVECCRERDAHLTVLVGYAIKRVGSGVRAGTARNRRDPTSRYSQLRSGLRVESLDVGSTDREWQQLIVNSRRTTPADVAALRIDLRCWLPTLSVRNRAIALMLAVGESTSHVRSCCRARRPVAKRVVRGAAAVP
jgi:hypothetical protein